MCKVNETELGGNWILHASFTLCADIHSFVPRFWVEIFQKWISKGGKQKYLENKLGFSVKKQKSVKYLKKILIHRLKINFSICLIRWSIDSKHSYYWILIKKNYSQPFWWNFDKLCTSYQWNTNINICLTFVGYLKPKTILDCKNFVYSTWSSQLIFYLNTDCAYGHTTLKHRYLYDHRS